MDVRAENNLRKIRIEKGLNQDVPARVLGTTRQRYARMENGHADISLGDLEKLAEFYHVSIRELTAHENENKSFLTMLPEDIVRTEELRKLDRLLNALREQETLFLSKNKRNDEKKKHKEPIRDNRFEKLPDEAEAIEEVLYPLSDEICGFYLEGIPTKNSRLLILNSSVIGIRREMVKLILTMRLQEFRRNPKDFMCLTYEELLAFSNDESCQLALRKKLVPRGKLYARIDDWFGISPDQLRILHTAALAEDFHVDIAFMIDSLFMYGMIDREQGEQLKKALRYYRQDEIRRMIGIHVSGNRSKEEEGRILIPLHYIDHILANFENGYIPFQAFAEIMKLCGINVDGLKGLRKPMDDRDNWDDWS